MEITPRNGKQDLEVQVQTASLEVFPASTADREGADHHRSTEVMVLARLGALAYRSELPRLTGISVFCSSASQLILEAGSPQEGESNHGDAEARGVKVAL